MFGTSIICLAGCACHTVQTLHFSLHSVPHFSHPSPTNTIHPFITSLLLLPPHHLHLLRIHCEHEALQCNTTLHHTTYSTSGRHTTDRTLQYLTTHPSQCDVKLVRITHYFGSTEQEDDSPHHTNVTPQSHRLPQNSIQHSHNSSISSALLFLPFPLSIDCHYTSVSLANTAMK